MLQKAAVCEAREGVLRSSRQRQARFVSSDAAAQLHERHKHNGAQRKQIVCKQPIAAAGW